MLSSIREFGKLLVVVVTGGLLIIVGTLFLFGENIPYLENLPGDIHFTYGDFRFYQNQHSNEESCLD